MPRVDVEAPVLLRHSGNEGDIGIRVDPIELTPDLYVPVRILWIENRKRDSLVALEISVLLSARCETDLDMGAVPFEPHRTAVRFTFGSD